VFKTIVIIVPIEMTKTYNYPNANMKFTIAITVICGINNSLKHCGYNT